MYSIEVLEPGVCCSSNGMRLLDVRGLDVETDGWTPVYLVYSDTGRAGVIEFEEITGYFKFTPTDSRPGSQTFGDFSIDTLKRRVADWLTARKGA